MSLLIKGIKMPQSCIACHLNFGEKRPEYGLTICCPYSDGVISWRDKAFDNGRLASCGIISVPPHGRLGDMDELKMKIKKEDNAYGFDSYGDGMYDAFQSVYQCIDDAPTIIPAEEE